MRLSVIICTHNPRQDYFARALSALAAQTLDQSKWELLIVDNRSEPPVAGRFDLSWRPDVRVFREETLGLTPARLRGIREARGELLVFVDDDNILDSDYLEQALRISEERPWLGSWSGQCRPEFEAEPEEWTRRYWGNLAIREFEHDVWSNLPRLVDTMPCGAGLCVRRPVAAHYLKLHDEGRRTTQFDRTGNSLMSGGDNDLAACACDVGLGVGLVSGLKLVHLMPTDRLTLDYLSRLAEGIHYSAILLDAERGLPPSRRGIASRLADVLRLAKLTGPDRRIASAAQRGTRRAERLLTSGK